MKYKDKISDWIKKHPGEEIISLEEFINEEITYESVIYDWVRYHRGEPIPKELMFSGWDDFTDPK